MNAMPILVNALVVVALVVLFAAGLRLPSGQGRWRIAARLLGVAAALAVVVLANVVAYRNDRHFDLTREKAFSPSAETMQVLHSLTEDVELVYFYQAQNPAGQAARQIVQIMGKVTPHLKVRTVDPDQQPALANQFGVRMYNAALLSAGDRRIEVVTTDDTEMALGIVRLLRSDRRPVCFLVGHGEYEIDNFEFHTHFEGSSGHSHDAVGQQVIEMKQHGIGRLRRALEKLGYSVRRLQLATSGGGLSPGVSAGVPADCAALVEANPRTPLSPPEVGLLARFLESGGRLLMMVEPDYGIGDELAALLARAGVRLGSGVVSDPLSHYFTDAQMVAVDKYARHPAVAGLALSFFPGARPLQALVAPGVKTTDLFQSSAEATLAARNPADQPAAAARAPAARTLALASEGQLTDGSKPFRLVVVGDADFASNSFFPYMANADLTLGLIAWLRGEQRGPTAAAQVEVLPRVALTNRQTQAIFLLCVLVLPGLCAVGGVSVWWRRQR